MRDYAESFPEFTTMCDVPSTSRVRGGSTHLGTTEAGRFTMRYKDGDVEIPPRESRGCAFGGCYFGGPLFPTED